MAVDVGLRPAGLPCWKCGGSVLRSGEELSCMQCGAAVEAPRAPLGGELRGKGVGRVGHFNLVKGRVT